MESSEQIDPSMNQIPTNFGGPIIDEEDASNPLSKAAMLTYNGVRYQTFKELHAAQVADQEKMLAEGAA